MLPSERKIDYIVESFLNKIRQDLLATYHPRDRPTFSSIGGLKLNVYFLILANSEVLPYT